MFFYKNINCYSLIILLSKLFINLIIVSVLGEQKHDISFIIYIYQLIFYGHSIIKLIIIFFTIFDLYRYICI